MAVFDMSSHGANGPDGLISLLREIETNVTRPETRSESPDDLLVYVSAMPPVRGYNSTAAMWFKRVLGHSLPSGPIKAISFIASPGPDASNFTMGVSQTEYGPSTVRRDGLCSKQTYELPANMRVQGAPIGFPVSFGTTSGRTDAQIVRVSESACGMVYDGSSAVDGGAFNVTKHNGVPVIAEPGAIGTSGCRVHKLWLRSPSSPPRYDSGWVSVQAEHNTLSQVDLSHETGVQSFANHELYGEVKILSGNNADFVAPMIYMMPFNDYFNEQFGGVAAMFNSTEVSIMAFRAQRYSN